MARSQFVWLLVFEDTTTKYIKAQTISQMMYCDEIDLDTVTNIVRIDTVAWSSDNDDYIDAIKIKYED